MKEQERQLHTHEEGLKLEFKAYIGAHSDELSPSSQSLSDMLSRIPFPPEHSVSTPYMNYLKRSWKATVPVAVVAVVLGASLYGYSSRSASFGGAPVTDLGDLSTILDTSEDSSDLSSENDVVASAYSQVINDSVMNEYDF